jgi:hypothetical protein
MQRIFTVIAALALLLISTPTQAQLLNKYCGHTEVVKQRMQENPYYLQNLEQWHQEFLAEKAALRGTEEGDTTYTIKVVVHIVYKEDNPIFNIPDDIIISQIEALNRDYNKLNADTSRVRDIFKPIIGNPKIRFELATTTPQGNPTNGITRKKATNNRPFGPLPLINANVKKNSDGGTATWQPNYHLNIWVCDLNPDPNSPGLLGGFAFAPPGLDNWPGGAGYSSLGDDGVVIDARFFGINNHYVQENPGFAAYANGRTTVHEVGHYFGLRHSWGDYGNLFPDLRCNETGIEIPGFGFMSSSDGISDTPLEAEPYANYMNACFEAGNSIIGATCICSDGIEANTCDTGPGDMPDLFENYMQYSADLCYAMFTQEQAEFMRWVLLNKRDRLIINRQIETPTGITVIRSNENRIDIFPNPSSGKLFVDQQLFNKGTIGVEVIDMLGKTVYTTSVNAAERQFTLDLPALASAMYFVNFKNEEISTTERILIKR